MSSDDRQRIVRVSGSRRAQLTPAPGSTDEPTAADADDPSDAQAAGPNDDRLRQDVPPHY
ncbi:hypothetical protein [Microbacterium rhizomatis]|uniref:Uncharacterized protein n=1 Tax=Microbacterium rhizomatis TaxID=1631477 RepID=A0A5J5IZT3_9MICO|nr:hypothetical protein [Microbacterium rhizomatis]KAA9105564.1 hypothetical protein F6B43_17465 [Microbacterium rhizomatis]